MTRLVVDSTCDLPAATMKEMAILMVPLKVHFGDEVFRDKVELDDEAFFDKLDGVTELPTTSQPSPGDFMEVYQQVPPGETILSIHIAEQLSGTQQSARLAAKAAGPRHPGHRQWQRHRRGGAAGDDRRGDGQGRQDP